MSTPPTDEPKPHFCGWPEDSEQCRLWHHADAAVPIRHPYDPEGGPATSDWVERQRKNENRKLRKP